MFSVTKGPLTECLLYFTQSTCCLVYGKIQYFLKYPTVPPWMPTDPNIYFSSDNHPSRTVTTETKRVNTFQSCRSFKSCYTCKTSHTCQSCHSCHWSVLPDTSPGATSNLVFKRTKIQAQDQPRRGWLHQQRRWLGHQQQQQQQKTILK